MSGLLRKAGYFQGLEPQEEVGVGLIAWNHLTPHLVFAILRVDDTDDLESFEIKLCLVAGDEMLFENFEVSNSIPQIGESFLVDGDVPILLGVLL